MKTYFVTIEVARQVSGKMGYEKVTALSNARTPQQAVVNVKKTVKNFNGIAVLDIKRVW